MRSPPVVSVIMAFKDGERFIRDAIDSVLSQSCRSWELLLVDDGSTDRGTVLARECAEKHPELIRYVEHPNHENRGVCVSRNVALRLAIGEYIAFLDVDDIWLPHKLERQLSILTAHPAAEMVYGSSQYWYSWSGNAEDLERDHIPDLGVVEDTLFEPPLLLTLLHPLGRGAAPPPSDVLVRRAAVERVGGFEEQFRGGLTLYEDQAFLAKLYLNSPVFVSSETWDKYRIHADSNVVRQNRSGQGDAGRLFFLDWLESYLRDHAVRDPRIWAVLHRSLRAYGRSVSHSGIDQIDPRAITWWLRLTRGNIASLVFPLADPEAVRVVITEVGKRAAFDVQANLTQFEVKHAHRYSIEYRARADTPRTMSVGLAQAHAPWNGLGLYDQVDLTTAWREYRHELVVTADDKNARIHFDLGDASISVELDSVRLRGPDGQLVEPAIVFQPHYPAERWTPSKQTPNP